LDRPVYQSYLVRIWLEGGRGSGQLQIWAKSVQTGQSHHFDDLATFQAFLQGQVHHQDPVDDDEDLPNAESPR
jgi:hypothetical protein